MRNLFCLIAVICSGGLFAEEVDSAFFAGNDEIRAYLLEAAEHHPGLQSLHEEWLAALETIPQAIALEDPMLSYTYFVQSNMDNYSLMLEQKLPWFGTRKIRGQQAEANAETARLRMFAARNELFARLKEVYFEYAYLAAQIKITEEQLELLSFAEETVRAKYSFGLASQDDVLRIQTEQSQVRDLRQQLDQMRPALCAKINEALGRPVDEAIPWPQEASSPPEPPDTDLLSNYIRTRNPEVLAMDYEIDSREKSVVLAKRKNYPDVSLRLEFMKGRYEGRMNLDPLAPSKLMAYRNLLGTVTGANSFDALSTGINAYEAGRLSEPGRPAEDKLTFGFTVNLPVWRKRIQSGVQEARHRVRASELSKDSLVRLLDSEARMLLFKIQDARRRQELYETDLIPKARQTYSGLQAAYASDEGNVSFLDLINSVKALLEFELQRVRAMRDWQQSGAGLEMLLGGPWPETS